MTPSGTERSFTLHFLGAALESRFRNHDPLAQLAVLFAVSDFIPVSSDEINPIISSCSSTPSGTDGITANLLKCPASRHLDMVLLIIIYSLEISIGSYQKKF